MERGINKTILSLAILKANWDLRRIDYVENFLPMFDFLITEKGYQEIEPNVIRSDFEEFFGLKIPYHPTIEILNRLTKRGLIVRVERKYVPNKSRPSVVDFRSLRDDKERELNSLAIGFCDFCNDKHSFKISQSDAEAALLSFLFDTSFGILSANGGDSVIPEQKSTKTLKFLVASFIKYSRENEPAAFGYLLNLEVGAALAVSIVYSDRGETNSLKFKNLAVYFDTGIVFSLLGINGQDKKEVYVELVESLKGLKAKIFIFEHTYDEALRIMRSALYRINQGAFEVDRSNGVLKYFLSEDYKSSDIELFIVKTQSALESLGISVVAKPDYSEDTQFQVDEPLLREKIVSIYREDPYFDETLRDDTISKDIKSIYSICKLRKGRMSFSLHQSSHVFVTTNHTLAHLSREALPLSSQRDSIPPLVTDLFLGTLVWVRDPKFESPINMKRLISDAYAAIQPDHVLISRYSKEVQGLVKQGVITAEECRVYSSNRMTYNLLAEKTMNDITKYDSKTTREIIQEINDEAIKNEKQETKRVKALHESALSELDEKSKRLNEIESDSSLKAEKRSIGINKIANKISSIFAVLVGAIFVVISIVVALATNAYVVILPAIIIAILSYIGINHYGVKKVVGDRIKLVLSRII